MDPSENSNRENEQSDANMKIEEQKENEINDNNENLDLGNIVEENRNAIS